jgi:hypothetical protein
MSDDTHDNWRLPVLQRLGAQFKQLEAEQADASPMRTRRRELLLIPAGVSATVISVVLLLSSGGANARSVINEAPTAAIRSASVQFRSTISIAVGGGTLQRFAQSGALDFARKAYRATLHLAGTKTADELRSLDGVLYVAGTNDASSATRRHTRWTAARLSPDERTALAFAPESDAITDPLAILRVLADIRAPVSRVESGSVDGVPSTRYRASSNLYSVLGASDPSKPHPLAYRQVPATLDAWLDHAGRPRHVLETFSGGTARNPITMRVAIEFLAYGRPVPISAPKGVTPTTTLRSGPPAPLIGAPSRIFEHLLSRPSPPT